MVTERPGGVEQPVERLAQLGVRGPTARRQIPLDVLDGARQDVEVVLQPVEATSIDDQLVGAEREVGGTLACDPVPLTAALRAELTRPAGTGGAHDHASAPPTARRPRSRRLWPRRAPLA